MCCCAASWTTRRWRGRPRLARRLCSPTPRRRRGGRFRVDWPARAAYGGAEPAADSGRKRRIASLGPLAAALADLLGGAAGVVRGLFFDKPPGADLVAAVASRHDDRGEAAREFGTLPQADGQGGRAARRGANRSACHDAHARIHLDAVTMQNGPLQVVPGSHRLDAAPRPVETILCSAGDVLLMRPCFRTPASNARPAARTTAASCIWR